MVTCHHTVDSSVPLSPARHPLPSSSHPWLCPAPPGSVIYCRCSSDHKLSHLRQRRLTVLQFQRSESNLGVTGLKPGCQLAALLPGGSRGRICFLVFSSFCKPSTLLSLWLFNLLQSQPQHLQIPHSFSFHNTLLITLKPPR